MSLIQMPKVVPEYKEQARQRIIEKSMQVFAEKGYHETTMEDVAGRVGVSEGAIYLYFKTKRDLYKAIARHSQKQAEEIVRASLQSGDPAKKFVDSVADYYDQFELNYGLIFELFSEASRDASFKKILRDDFDGDIEIMHQFLREALKRRGLRVADADAQSIAFGFLWLGYGYAISRVLGVGKDDAKRAYVASMKTMLDGISRGPTSA